MEEIEKVEENEKFGKYRVNIDPEDLIEIYIDKWVLKWCKEYHPEAFEAAEKVMRKLMDEDKSEKA